MEYLQKNWPYGSFNKIFLRFLKIAKAILYPKITGIAFYLFYEYYLAGFTSTMTTGPPSVPITGFADVIKVQ